ncbi:unnamed protein product [Alternaria alternata]
MTSTATSVTEPEEAHPEGPCLYQYSSLEDKPRTIRLLKIEYDVVDRAHNPSGRCDHYRESDRCKHACCQKLNPEKLKVSLHEACLNDNPKYEAISYAWGSADLVQQVACHNKWLSVTQSCYDLLSRLRDLDSRVGTGGARFYDLLPRLRRQDLGLGTSRDRYYWIDAICINQGFREKDTPEQRSQQERSHQVAMMATIYEKAVRVLVWPGHVEAGPKSDLGRALDSGLNDDSDKSNAIPGPNTPPPMSELLLHARSHRASEPRDKVFALYGIFQRLQAFLEAPNYLRSVEDIYVEATVTAIRKDRSLRVLEGLTGFSRFRLPSWSPDWSDHRHITKVAEWTDHKAGGPRDAQPSILGRQLLARGLLIDVVCLEHITFGPTSFLLEADTLTEVLIEPLRDPSNLPARQYFDVLERLFLDIWGTKEIENLRDRTHRIWVLKHANAEMENLMVCKLIGYQDSRQGGFLRSSAILHEGLCRRLDRKKLLQTRGGRLGIASRNIQIGDSIVLLESCNLPMVVRPEGNKWKLVAPAYVPADGIMDGNMWKPDGPLSCFSFI